MQRLKNLGTLASQILFALADMFPPKKWSERLNFTAFYEALLEAKGINLGDSGVAGIGKGGRKLSYIATVQGNGNLLIKAYTALLDLKAGDELKSSLEENK